MTGALLVAVLLAAPAPAAVMSAPGVELARHDLDCAGGPGFAAGDGSASLAFALGQQGGVEALAAAAASLIGGFYAGAGWSGSASGAPLASGGACPLPATRRSGGLWLGLPQSQALCVAFDRPMLPATLSSALRVVRLRDRDGSDLSAAVAVEAQYLADANSLILASSAGWQANSLYAVEVGTAAADQDGAPLAVPATFQFLTLADPAVENTFVALEDTGTRLRLPAGALPGPGYVEIHASAPDAPRGVSSALVAAANEKLRGTRGPFARVHTLREADYFDAAGNRLPLSFPAAAAALRIPYADVDGDGVIDGTTPPAQAREASLLLLDEARALWTTVPGSGAGPAGAVTGAVPHLSVFALATASDSDPGRAYAFPSPFRPHGPNAGTGSGQSGTESGGITFIELPSPSEVEVFDVLGDRVWRGSETSGTGRVVWDARGPGGAPAASGVYFYVIRAQGGRTKTGKLAIIR